MRVTQMNADDHFPNMALELLNVHEYQSKLTYM